MTSSINWGPEKPYTGNGDCPADARDVPCVVQDKGFGWIGHDYNRTGDFWQWESVTAYRTPIAEQSMADELEDALKYYQDQLCEGFCEDLPTEGFYTTEMDTDCGGCKARAVLAKYRETKK